VKDSIGLPYTSHTF